MDDLQEIPPKATLARDFLEGLKGSLSDARADLRSPAHLKTNSLA